jgi:phosphatase NudJ
VSREAIPSHSFALCVVRRGHRYLLVEEKKHGQTWYLPGGRVEPGETLMDAAVRETLEESGVPVVLDGLLRLEHTPGPRGLRLRAIFTAHPADDTPPKSTPDEHTLRAGWFSPAEMADLQLRGEDVARYITLLEGGAPVAPLSLIGQER